METDSYNEFKKHQTVIRHLFLPNKYMLIGEFIFSVIILMIFNGYWLSSHIFGNEKGDKDPVSFFSDLFNTVLLEVQKEYLIQQISIFMLWAVAGALIYILIFRSLQVFFGVGHSVSEGVSLTRKEHKSGLIRWLSSLQDIFLKSLIIISCLVILIGALVCFGAASQELRASLVYDFPRNAYSLVLSLIGAFVSVRFVTLTLCLLSERFRSLYTNS